MQATCQEGHTAAGPVVTCSPMEEADASHRADARQIILWLLLQRKGTDMLNPQVACKITVGNDLIWSPARRLWALSSMA